jgi:hypothetical protein
MTEELRLFLRTALYAAAAGVVYWLVSYEPAGTVLLAALLLALIAFIAVAIALAPSAVAGTRGRGALGIVNRVLGFDEPPNAAAPLEGRPELIPTTSPWPIISAAAAVLIGLGMIFGPWLLVPGVVLLAAAVVGWITQLDRR